MPDSSVELRTAANGYVWVTTFSLWQRLRLGLLLTFRHGFRRKGRVIPPVADEGIYPDFVRGTTRIECGYDNWVGSYFLASDPESDRFLRDFYSRHVSKSEAVEMKASTRVPIAGKSRCVLCKDGGDAASDFEWFCTRINDWLCETHCAELQIASYPGTRKHLAQVIGFSGDQLELAHFCDGGPFGPIGPPGG